MNVSVFGLGHVGTVTAACLAAAGHHVIGVDVDAAKVDTMSSGRSPVQECDIPELIDEVTKAGRLRATTDANAAIAGTDLALIAVGTPGHSDGEPDLSALAEAGRQIGNALRGQTRQFTVVLRSTAPPGTTENVLLQAVRAAAGSGPVLCAGSNPEFLREGSAREDFNRPPLVLVGCEERRVETQLRELYAGIDAPFVASSIRAAEAVKYASNAFHALKVCFTNEIAEICRAAGANAAEVMKVFAMDRTLNISDAYLKPGFAFGGPCLSKDVQALVWAAARAGVAAPVLGAILPSNRRQTDLGVAAILAASDQCVGVVGLGFKAGTTDLRGSATVDVVRALVAAGRDVRVYDHGVAAAKAVGANAVPPAMSDLAPWFVDDFTDLLAHADVIVLGTGATKEDERRARAGGGRVVDLRHPETWSR